jgi:hypothetical protein
MVLLILLSVSVCGVEGAAPDAFMRLVMGGVATPRGYDSAGWRNEGMGDACGHGLPVYDPPPEKPPYADRTPMGDPECHRESQQRQTCRCPLERHRDRN